MLKTILFGPFIWVLSSRTNPKFELNFYSLLIYILFNFHAIKAIIYCGNNFLLIFITWLYLRPWRQIIACGNAIYNVGVPFGFRLILAIPRTLLQIFAVLIRISYANNLSLFFSYYDIYIIVLELLYRFENSGAIVSLEMSICMLIFKKFFILFYRIHNCLLKLIILNNKFVKVCSNYSTMICLTITLLKIFFLI